MHNPFIIIRFVFFALLVNLNLLILVFAAWNANAITAVGLSTSATSIFLVFNSCAALLCILLGLAELVMPRLKTSRLPFECAWSATLSLLQTGTAISITVNGPTICRQTSNWDICASSYLLLPTTWLSSVLFMTYFVALFIVSMAHIRVYPELWSKTVYSVRWFNQPDTTFLSEGHDAMSKLSLDSWSRHIDDLEASRTIPQDQKAPWAQAKKIRRGVDTPFKTQGCLASLQNSPSTVNSALPVAPLNVQTKSIAGSRFIEKFRESKTLSRSDDSSQYGLHFSRRVDPFPPRVDNHDLPIPLPRLSEWIRADAIKGINVHTVPSSP